VGRLPSSSSCLRVALISVHTNQNVLRKVILFAVMHSAFAWGEAIAFVTHGNAFVLFAEITRESGEAPPAVLTNDSPD